MTKTFWTSQNANFISEKSYLSIIHLDQTKKKYFGIGSIDRGFWTSSSGFHNGILGISLNSKIHESLVNMCLGGVQKLRGQDEVGKGHLISKCPFGVFKSTKKQTKIL